MSRFFIHQVHIADGFADDCEELIHCCLKADTLNYEIFCDIWKEMKFCFLYHGRRCGAEIIELSEELIHIAKHYMIVDTSNFEESVAGLFLVYALVNLQPYKRFASLRIVPEDVPAIHRIETMARNQKRYDVLYILGSLLTEGPVQYHATARERGMESSIRKYLEGYTGIDRAGVRPHGVFHRQNEELDLLRELASITKRYAKAKEAVAGVNNRNLNYTSATFATELDASLKRVINGIVTTKDDEPEQKTTSMASVREKAMKQTVEGVRHLRSAANKTLSPEKPLTRSPEKTVSRAKCEIKQKPGKVKQISPKKPVNPSRSKPAKAITKRKRKRKPLKKYDTTSSEESENTELEKLSDGDDEQDLNLESFSKEKETSKETNTENEVSEQTLLNISIDSLPVFIREEQDGKMYEIEIIDHLKPNVKDEQVENAKKSRKCKSGEGNSSVATHSLQPVKINEKLTTVDTVKTKDAVKKTKETVTKDAEIIKDTVKTKDSVDKTKDTVTKDTDITTDTVKAKGPVKKTKETVAKDTEITKDTVKTKDPVKKRKETVTKVTEITKDTAKTKVPVKKTKAIVTKDTGKSKDTVKKKGSVKKTKEILTEDTDTMKDTEKDNNTVKTEGKANSQVMLKRRDKRELKKPLLKSKFKRLGMLKVANFNEPGKSDTTEDSQKEKE